MTLPLKPPLKPQLAKSARELPEGDQWCYEPKFDGFRTIVFRDGDDVQLQSRNGRPMNRYFPDVVEQVLALPHERLVLDGEMIVVVDGIQEFDLLSQRIHPAASRVERLRRVVPPGMTMPELVLRHILAHPAVSTVIPGMRKVRHVEQNIGVSDQPPLPEPLLTELRTHRWNRTVDWE